MTRRGQASERSFWDERVIRAERERTVKCLEQKLRKSHRIELGKVCQSESNTTPKLAELRGANGHIEELESNSAGRKLKREAFEGGGGKKEVDLVEDDADKLLGRTARIARHEHIGVMPGEVRGIDEARHAAELNFIELEAEEVINESDKFQFHPATVRGRSGAASAGVRWRKVHKATLQSESVSSSKRSMRPPQ